MRTVEKHSETDSRKRGSAPDLPRSALVIYKKSKLDLYVHERKNERYAALLDAGAEVVGQMQGAHDTHATALASVKEALLSRGFKTKLTYRARLRAEATEGQLVVTVGGDGTLLDASRKVTNAPVLGVNSDPTRSVGFLCAATAASFPEILDQVLAGETSTTPVARLRLSLDGVVTGHPVLNDVLVADRNPAATVRYLLEAQGKRESHKSSGIWIAGPAGSTGAMYSAGGQVLALDDPRMQLKVRECFHLEAPPCALTHLLLDRSDKVRVTSKLREGRLYLDGSHHVVPFPVGSVLEVSSDAPPLALVVTDAMRSRRAAVA